MGPPKSRGGGLLWETSFTLGPHLKGTPCKHEAQELILLKDKQTLKGHFWKIWIFHAGYISTSSRPCASGRTADWHFWQRTLCSCLDSAHQSSLVMILSRNLQNFVSHNSIWHHTKLNCFCTHLPTTLSSWLFNLYEIGTGRRECQRRWKEEGNPFHGMITHFNIQYRKEIATHQEQMFLTVHKHPSNTKSLVIHTLPYSFDL